MVTNRWFKGNEDISEALRIREEVFIKEQKCPIEAERDETDRDALHLVVYSEDIPIGCGRIEINTYYYKIGRIAVLKPERGKHYGDLIVRLLLFKSFDMGASEVLLGAQVHAAEFYKRFGFEPIGEIFMEAGIEHVGMKVTKEKLVYPSDCSS